ncbi:uncharacterized protein EI90DRAFT_3159384 [Cantharellus anzutake]|uniref:uncharacterized protein n=1 Tax=Cantharellus anzutake TaxID=1750568 RepID=UPI001906AF8F|nr:uncharacterized protein EI90DRAFT_3159384 [Cantharellus anzutake]KAF8314825.1 hypothetical protein EI90DRAFT_3159384 [Cantharellus anzutake]
MKRTRHIPRQNAPNHVRVEESSSESASELRPPMPPYPRAVEFPNPSSADPKNLRPPRSPQPRYRAVSPSFEVSSAKDLKESELGAESLGFNSISAPRDNPVGNKHHKSSRLQPPRVSSARYRSRSPSNLPPRRERHIADDISSSDEAGHPYRKSMAPQPQLQHVLPSPRSKDGSTTVRGRDGGLAAPPVAEVPLSPFTGDAVQKRAGRFDTPQRIAISGQYRLAEGSNQATPPYAAMMMPRPQALDQPPSSVPSPSPTGNRIDSYVGPIDPRATPTEGSKSFVSSSRVTFASRPRASTFNLGGRSEANPRKPNLDRKIPEVKAISDINASKDQTRNGLPASNEEFRSEVSDADSQTSQIVIDEERSRSQKRELKPGLRSKSVGHSSHSAFRSHKISPTIAFDKSKRDPLPVSLDIVTDHQDATGGIPKSSRIPQHASQTRKKGAVSFAPGNEYVSGRTQTVDTKKSRAESNSLTEARRLDTPAPLPQGPLARPRNTINESGGDLHVSEHFVPGSPSAHPHEEKLDTTPIIPSFTTVHQDTHSQPSCGQGTPHANAQAQNFCIFNSPGVSQATAVHPATDRKKRLSALKRITLTQTAQPEQRRLARDLSHVGDYSRSPGPTSANDASPLSNPLFLALTDALSQSNPSALHSAGYPRLSWLGDNDAEEQYWTPVDDSAQKPAAGHFPSVSSPISYVVAPKIRGNKNSPPEQPAVQSAFSSFQSDLSSLVTDEPSVSDTGTSISAPAEELFKTLEDSRQDENHSSSTRHHNDLSGVEPKTWRETLTDDAYAALLAKYDVFEMRRQEVIWELRRSESDFIADLQTAVRLFVQPLRVEHNTRWIPGLNSDIAKLFDWLDDIAQLHRRLLSTMQGCRENQFPIVTQIAESLRPFVSELEVYQPYLVHLDDCIDWIEGVALNPDSDFGEFIRIQSMAPECPASLSVLLQKPVQRLLRYPSRFKELLSLTPHRHPDHLSMFSLLHSTELVIRVLQTVKLRESEYTTVKHLAAKIHGLPTEFELASRERRLIAQGPLLRLRPAEGDPNNEIPPLRTPLIRKYSPDPLSPDSGSPTLGSKKYKERHSPRRTPKNTYDHSMSNIRHRDNTPDTSVNIKVVITKAEEPEADGAFEEDKWIYAFVFTDVVVLTETLEWTAPISRHHGMDSPLEDSWDLLEDIGLARVLGFSDLSTQARGHLIAVDLLPLDVGSTEHLHSSATRTYFSLQASSEVGPNNVSTVLGDARQQWNVAFGRCYVYTLRSLCFPEAYSMDGSRKDTRPRTILSVLSSGQPLPRSPSLQLQDTRLDSVNQEREERVWWAMRFRQILEEVTSRDDVEDFTPPVQSDMKDNVFDDHNLAPNQASNRSTSLFKEATSKLFRLRR